MEPETGGMDVLELLRLADSMEHGAVRMSLYEQAVEQADRQENIELQITARLRAYEEHEVYGPEDMGSFVMFPVLLKLADRYRESTGKYPMDMYSILWDYKWMLGNGFDFYQVTREQFDGMAEDCIRRYKEAGYSPRPIYAYLFNFYQNIDKERAKVYYNEFLRQKRDSMSDCLGCERGRDVRFLLAYGWEKKALEKADSIFKGRISCEVQPAGVGHSLLRYTLYRKLFGKPVAQELEDHLAEYADWVRQAIVRKHRMKDTVGDLLSYYCMYEPNKALSWLKRCCDYTEENKAPKPLFDFALGMMLFLKRLRETSTKEKKVYRMKIDSRFRFYQESGIYDIQEMYDYYDGLAGEIAEQFMQKQGRRDCMEVYEAAKRFRFQPGGTKDE